MLRATIVVSFIVALAASDAMAQEACVHQQSGQVDVNATQAFMDMASRTDPRLAQALAGSWYSETPSPMTGQISRLMVTYSADGQLSYENQVCDQSGFCSQYQGNGLWAAILLGDGSISGVQMVSDQGRNHECTGFSARLLDAGTLQYGAGGIARRVR